MSTFRNDEVSVTYKTDKSEKDMIMSDINMLNNQMCSVNISSPHSGGPNIMGTVP